MKHPLGSVILVIVSTLCIRVGGVLAEPETAIFVHEDYRFRILVPQPFISMKNPAVNVGVLLKHPNGYPSFNVVIIPGEYKISKQKPETHIKRIIDEYNMVGIQVVEPILPRTLNVSGRESFAVELKYHFGESDLHSTVVLVPGLTQHFILTFIDREGAFETSRDILDGLLNSFQTWADKELMRSNEVALKPTSKFYLYLSLGLLGLVALALGFHYWRGHHHGVTP
jgi:hypothetical protein